MRGKKGAFFFLPFSWETTVWNRAVLLWLLKSGTTQERVGLCKEASSE